MSQVVIRSLPVLSDNYAHFIHDPATGATACIDPADDPAILKALNDWDWNLTEILITHPHWDHVDGIKTLVKAFGAEVYGSRSDLGKIPSCDFGVLGGDGVKVGPLCASVIHVPGHTSHHVAYYFSEAGALFCGDSLFSLGCGRLLGGTAAEMWSSLKRLSALPEDTKIYCAHEYTQANGRFALHVDPDNADLKIRMEEVNELRAQGLPTVPSTLASELKCNPFLRCRDEQEFTELRRLKDHF